MAEKTYLTQEGLDKIKEELHWRKTVERADIADKIKEARAFGDLSENAEYDAAQEALAISESRIKYLEELLKNVELIDENGADSDKVTVGCSVTIVDCEFPDDSSETYTLVGRTESDPDNNKISDQSPLGKALIGKKIGDTVTVEAPGGEYSVKITNSVRG